ncbi:MAG: pilus assembly protein PilM, partial [Candidatus Omnitrophica bacterium]|nr:pilus assembly protein PilM [Candidatus Omnitrophota bacterium]
MAKRGIGIYIGRKFIDIACVSGSIYRPLLIDYATKEIKTPDTHNNEESHINKDIKEALELFFSKVKAKPDEIFTSLPESAIMVRHFNMPVLHKTEQGQAIRFEAKKYIPFKIDEVISDFKIINTAKETKTMSIFFAAAQKKDVELQLKYLQSAGIDKIAGIDIAPLALLKVLGVNNKFKKDETVALLQLNRIEEVATINIIEGNYPAVSRDIGITQYKDTLPDRLMSEL